MGLETGVRGPTLRPPRLRLVHFRVGSDHSMRLGTFTTIALLAAGGMVYWARDNAPREGAERHEPAGSSFGEPLLATPPPGTEVTLRLIHDPATHYGDDGDDDYREIAERVAGGRATYDIALARAAREVAFQAALLGRSPPEDALAFLLHAAGAPEANAARFALHTNSEGDDAIERAIAEALSQPPAGAGDIVFGVGEADTPGQDHSRRVVVLSARRRFAIERTPRFADLGSIWTLRGRLPAGFRDPVAAVLYPDGRLRPLPVSSDGSRFELRVPTGGEIGSLEVGIDGDGPEGPGKLLQLRVEVGQPLPRELVFEIPEVEPPLASVDEAEALAAALLARDREEAGAGPLVIDPALSAIARRHSEEMRELGYFGHRSPQSGLPADRLRAAGYLAGVSAENLAKNDSVIDAQASLLASVGHRANLLSERFTHVGVGIARADEGGQIQWYVTQLFAGNIIARPSR